MKSVKGKLFSVLLAVILLIGMMPATAFAEGTRPNLPTIKTDEKASLTIYKYNGGEGDKSKPLAGVTFTYLKVADIEQITTNNVSTVAYKLTNSAFATAIGLETAEGDYKANETKYFKSSTIQEKLNAKASDMKKFILSEKIGGSKEAKDMAETGEDGKTEAKDLDLGLYLVVETAYPAMVTTVTSPFIVSLPMPNGIDKDGNSENDKESTAWNYDVVAYPKNTVGDQPEIDKNIVKGDKLTKVDDVKIGDTVTYQINAEIPANVEKLQYFCIKDTLSDGLTFKEVTGVKAIKGNDKKDLTENTNYKVSQDGKDVIVAFINKAVLKDYDSVQITLTTEVNSSAVIGGDGNPNTATLVYSNKTSSDFDDTKVNPDPNVDTVEAKKPIVYTYGIDVTKVNGKGDKLSGAVFELQDASSKKIKEITSGTDGSVVFKGLDAGTYYLVETKAPAGYNLLKDRIKLVIKSTESFTEDSASGSYIKVEDNAKYYTYKNGNWADLKYTNDQLVENDGAKYLNVGNKKVYSEEDKAKQVAVYTEKLTWEAKTYTMGTDGYVKFDVVNNTGIELPKTGGAGTLAFTLGGLALILLAGVYFIGSKKKQTTK